MLRSNKINLYIRVMKRLGISADALLAGTNIDVNSLADPQYTVTQAMYHAVIFNMLKLSKNPGIAFEVGREMNFGDLGVAGYALMASHNLGQALGIRQSYSQAFFGTQINIESVHEQGSGYELTISSISPTERLKQFEIEEYFATGLKLMESLVAGRPDIRNISFSYPKPAYYAEYEKLFNCPMVFGAAKTVLNMRYPSLNTLVVTRNEEMFEICVKHCQKIMNSSGVSSQLREQLCNLFLATPGNLPDLNSAAASLGMSPRSLSRKLKEEDRSYEDIKAEFRLDLSRQLLSEAKMTPKQIAYFLGYHSPSSFSRAFKVWTGQTVRNFAR